MPSARLGRERALQSIPKQVARFLIERHCTYRSCYRDDDSLWVTIDLMLTNRGQGIAREVAAAIPNQEWQFESAQYFSDRDHVGKILVPDVQDQPIQMYRYKLKTLYSGTSVVVCRARDRIKHPSETKMVSIVSFHETGHLHQQLTINLDESLLDGVVNVPSHHQIFS